MLRILRRDGRETRLHPPVPVWVCTRTQIVVAHTHSARGLPLSTWDKSLGTAKTQNLNLRHHIPKPIANHPLPPPTPPYRRHPILREQALTSINHPGGPAGLAAAIAAHAFPSEEGGAPAPRGAQSPARRASSGAISTPPRSEGRRRSSSGGRSLLDGGGVAGASPMRPRFITPGRLRRSAFAAKGRASSFGGGSTLRFAASPDRSRAKATAARPHRLPLSAAALEAASHAVGLSTALGYAPPALDPHRGMTARAVYRAAELLYSRHALGLRWSKGALVVAQTAAAANAAEMATASMAAAAAVAARRKNRVKSKRSGGKSSGGGGGGRAAKEAEYAWQWGVDMEVRGPSETGGKAAAGRDSGGGGGADVGGRLSPRRISQSGEVEDTHRSGYLADGTTTTTTEAPEPAEEGEGANPKAFAASSTKSRIEVRTVSSPRDGMYSAAPKALVPRKVPPSPGPAPMVQSRSKKKAPTGRGNPQENGGADRGREGRHRGKGDGVEAAAGDGSKGTDDGAGTDAAVLWTWGGGGSGKGASNGEDLSKTPLPSDLRQLSR